MNKLPDFKELIEPLKWLAIKQDNLNDSVLLNKIRIELEYIIASTKCDNVYQLEHLITKLDKAIREGKI